MSFALPTLTQAPQTGPILAFASGYQTTNKCGGTVVYGIVLGFVLYVGMGLVGRLGLASVITLANAAAGTVFAAIVIGLTVLLHKQDGRA